MYVDKEAQLQFIHIFLNLFKYYKAKIFTH
jgi:hypothetical protein